MFKQRLDEIQDLIVKIIILGEKEDRVDSKNIIEMSELGSTLQSSKHL